MKTRLRDRALQWFRTLNAGPGGAGGPRVELRLPRGWPETDPSVHWWRRTGDPATERAGRADDLAHLPAEARMASVHVWTPPAETLLTRTRLPTRSRARILQALPYALEDQLLDEPENLHFAYVREADGGLAVAVTQRARLNVWLEELKSAGIRPASLCPAHLALPLQLQAWSAAFVDDELWVRTGEHAGFVTLAASTPPPLLQAALKEAGGGGAGPAQLAVYAPPPDLELEAWRTALELPVTAESADVWQRTQPPAFNLLQADFGQTAHLRQLARPLRPAIAMLIVWLAASLVIDLAEWWRLRQQYQTYRAEMHEVYRSVFGGSAQYPYEQMRRGIETLEAHGGGTSDLLPLLSRVAPALQERRAQVKIQNIKYSDRGLTLELTLPDYQALDGMKNALQSAALNVEVLAAAGRGDEVESRLRVQSGAAAAEPGRRS